jgi:hypothetical protein
MNATQSVRAIQALEQYLAALTTRIKRWRLTVAAAALAATLLLLTVLGVYLSMRQGFGGFIVNTMRALLLLAIVTLVLWLIVWPFKKLNNNPAKEIESRTPEFAGRLAAFADARERGNPLTELLAEDTMKVAAQHPVEHTIKPRDMQLTLVLAVAAVVTLLWLAVSGPGLWSYGTRYLWAGWAVPTLKPEQSIAVQPGNQSVRRGGNVPVVAQMQGFAPGTADVYVQMGDDQWQQVAMTRTDKGFAFTFFSVREALKYYVAAGGIRSRDYQINVVDLPSINNLKLTYHFPTWTGRKPEVVEPGGDVTALKDTRIDVDASADAPLPATQLVLDENSTSMNVDGTHAAGSFTVQKEGRYYLVATVAGENVRLSDDYFIRVMDDAKPDIKVVRPGRDYGASSIEEVTTHIDASDDYGLNEVTLHYAVNGAKWQTIALPAGKQSVSDDHVFALESLGDQGAALKPGDLISYYAEAKDHSSAVRTDMFFVDVRPFDKRYSQSQQAAGAQGQGQQNQQGEISQRQREIIVSTWNLIREQEEKSADNDKIEDNSKLLSELQTKLAAQASSLTQRMQARELDSSDAQSKEFSEAVKQAVAAMTPAAKALNQVELSDAIGPEQQALQYLLRAESVYNEIQVQQQQQGQGGQGGGGQQDSRDMAQIYELEMDLNKNQYESRSNASPAEQNQNQDDLEDKLKDLARRQQQLAEAARNQKQLTQEQRWQQESLKREAEQLQRQLQQQASNQQNGQQNGQQSGQQGSQQSGQQGGQQSGQQGAQSGQQASNQELQQRLQSAIRAMDESASAMRNTNDSGERARAQRAATEAQRQLNGASDAVARGQQQSQQTALNNLAEQAGRLYENQAQFDRKLQDTIKQLRAQTLSDTDADDGGITPQEKQLANDKRSLSTQLENLRRDMIAAQRVLKEQAPQTVAQIGDASKQLDDKKLDQRMSLAATYIERGQAPFVVASESLVTDTLRDVRDELNRAASRGVGSAVNDDKASDAVEQVRALRQQLEQFANRQRASQVGNQQATNDQSANGSASTMNQGSRQAGQQGAQPAAQGNAQDGMQASQAAGQGNGQNGQNGMGTQAGAPSNGWQGFNGMAAQAVGIPVNLNRNLDRTLQETRAAINELNQRGRLNQRDAQQLQDIARQLDSLRVGSGGGIRKGAEPTALALMEQLELKLSQASERNNAGKQTVRSAVTEPVPSDYEDAVAEYYRRLSK